MKDAFVTLDNWSPSNHFFVMKQTTKETLSCFVGGTAYELCRSLKKTPKRRISSSKIGT